ncbi:MAG TPA: hypothetical protein VMM84_09365 [Pyrinomonadaceae bacterium]|nr:hypothetical protein [Pyrinomonadaceae bacterium]
MRNLTIKSQEGRPRLSEAAVRVLGENGERRFQEFAEYETGWNMGQGKALSIRSVALLERFLHEVPELADCSPSLFLSSEGNLELGWEDDRGNVIEIEFGPDHISYYIESLSEDRSVPLEVLPHFIERIKLLIANASPTVSN